MTSRWKAPANVNRIAVEGHTYEVRDVDHYNPRTDSVETVRGVDVPDHLDAHMKQSGFDKLAKPRDLRKVTEKLDGQDDEVLRTDGPTFQEYLDAGYWPEGYPPRGYASKHSPEELAALRAEHVAKTKPAGVAEQAAAIARQAAELKALSSEELVGWLKEQKVDEEKIKNAPNKPLRLQLALDTIGFVEPKKAD